MIKTGTKVRIKPNSLGYLHPNISDNYTMRHNFTDKIEGICVKAPEKDDGSYSFFIQLKSTIIPKMENGYFAFKSQDLIMLDDNGLQIVSKTKSGYKIYKDTVGEVRVDNID